MKRAILTICAAIALSLTLLSNVASSDEPAVNGQLSVQVLGVQDAKGRVCVTLYDDEDPDAYPDEGKHHRIACAKAKEGKVFLVFKDLAPGSYAAFAFHDADSNGKIKKNFIGMPKEGVGASRGAKGFMGPPKFKDAAFAVTAAKKFIQIKLKYL